MLVDVERTVGLTRRFRQSSMTSWRRHVGPPTSTHPPWLSPASLLPADLLVLLRRNPLYNNLLR